MRNDKNRGDIPTRSRAPEKAPGARLFPIMPVMSAETALGIYANGASLIQNRIETVLDFSRATPGTIDMSIGPEAATQSAVAGLQNQIVARLILPTPIWEEFLRAYLRDHPEITETPGTLAAALASDREETS